MADRSHRFGLTIFNQETDQLDYEDWKFGLSDRKLVDRLLAYAAEHHTHDGRTVVVSPPVAPTLTPASGGVLPAGSTVYYKYAYIDDRGQEEIASNMGVYHTPPQIVAPGPPTITKTTGGLMPGTYIYAVSAYTGTTRQETQVGRTVGSVLVGVFGGFSLAMPTPPSGADGFNIYRKAPTDDDMVFLGSIQVGAGDYVDVGSVTPDRYRLVPSANTTRADNAVSVTVPLPAGYTWKLYRTFDPSNWATSLVEWSASATIVDTGHSTKSGSPPSTSAAVGSAPKVQLTDMAEVQGTLPPGVVVHPEVITFTVQGSIAPGYGVWPFVCEWDRCEVVSVRAALGIGAAPAAQPVVCSLEKRYSGYIAWAECLDSYEFAQIPVGQQIGPLTPVNPYIGDSVVAPVFTLGDAMRLVIRQAGGGATPTDVDLVVTVTVLVQGGSATETYTWETS